MFSSEEWQQLTAGDRKNLGLVMSDDGEFWWGVFFCTKFTWDSTQNYRVNNKVPLFLSSLQLSHLGWAWRTSVATFTNSMSAAMWTILFLVARSWNQCWDAGPWMMIPWWTVQEAVTTTVTPSCRIPRFINDFYLPPQFFFFSCWWKPRSHFGPFYHICLVSGLPFASIR